MASRAIEPWPTAANQDLFPTLSQFGRRTVETFVAAAIEYLDCLDGDCDLEEGGDLELNGDESGHCGGLQGPMLATRPVYGVDQSEGPLNEHAATEHYHRHLRETGAEPIWR